MFCRGNSISLETVLGEVTLKALVLIHYHQKLQ